MKKSIFLSGFYILSVIFLFLYSYTQVDLSLTLSRVSIYQTIEKSFQYIGYFQRPISTLLFSFIIFLLFSLYGALLFGVSKKWMTRKQIWTLIISSTIILTFSYNAFSYDLFNYIFDAKIVTFYHQNPYMHKALDYPGDPMLSFMRWTHRTYPYGPVWLAISIPLSFVGLHFFLVTFFLFKICTALFFLGSVYFIAKILQQVSPKEELFGITLFALNPLLLIEAVISSHNDIVMMFFAVVALYFLLVRKNLLAFLFLLLSIGIKFATVFLLPVFIYIVFLQKMKKSINWKIIFFWSGSIMIPAIFLAGIRSNFQPWYLLFALPFIALLGKKYYAIFPTVLLSFLYLFEYAPFIYYGDYNPPVPAILLWITVAGIVCTIGTLLVFFLKNHYAKKTNMLQ